MFQIREAYFSSSTEFKKVRVDRYRAKIGPPHDQQQMLFKIYRWKDNPMIELSKDKVYVVETKVSVNVNPNNGMQYINNDILFLKELESMDALYTYIFTKSAKDKNEVPATIYRREPSDDLPF